MASDIECVVCGLVPFDLPDGVDPEFVFEPRKNGWTCIVHDERDGADHGW